MRVRRIISASGEGLPFSFGGDRAYVSVWPKNPDGQDLLLLFSIDCKAASQRLNRVDLPSQGYLHVFSTYDPDDYFLDSITIDEVQLKRGCPSYTYVVHSVVEVAIQSPRPSIPLAHADFDEVSVAEGEMSTSSMVYETTPVGQRVFSTLSDSFSFFCQVYSSDFPEPFKDALYLSDATGYLLINKQLGGELADGCFFVQAA
ncbi:DUF1963 domain-containing protein [Pseudomonas sp. CC120222-01a]|uniref:DUF1963 domain-containing protein n=1 Tax=Pseudomonas sp. CC120222-01a TaxID=1378075 RepID=UPI000D9D133F|nr:DUF1963 domain-containing protein [Pseudomonas sp. CC120222-01a]PVZ32482.1 uncharacterized protein DUF1963 [Pseudomonas sp. CC120222-01a]